MTDGFFFDLKGRRSERGWKQRRGWGEWWSCGEWGSNQTLPRGTGKGHSSPERGNPSQTTLGIREGKRERIFDFKSSCFFLFLAEMEKEKGFLRRASIFSKFVINLKMI